MTTAESLAAWLLVSVFVACLWRARLLALAILPPLALSAVQWLELVDTSSASQSSAGSVMCPSCHPVARP